MANVSSALALDSLVFFFYALYRMIVSDLFLDRQSLSLPNTDRPNLLSSRSFRRTRHKGITTQ
jgi:hypothetical protein